MVETRIIIENESAYSRVTNFSYTLDIDVVCPSCGRWEGIRISEFNSGEGSIDCECGASIQWEVDGLVCENDLTIEAWVENEEGDTILINNPKKIYTANCLNDFRNVFKLKRSDPDLKIVVEKANKKEREIFKTK